MTQAKANAMRLSGRDEDAIAEELWKPHNEVTGQRMYDLCVDLRGFYLKVLVWDCSWSGVCVIGWSVSWNTGGFYSRGDLHAAIQTA